MALRAAGKFADLRRNKRELLSEGINDPNQIDDLQLGNTSKFAPGCHEIHRRPPEPRVPGEPPPHAFINQVAWTVIFPGEPALMALKASRKPFKLCGLARAYRRGAWLDQHDR